MTPEERAQFNTMLQKVNELYQFMQARKRQQLSYPVDDASKASLGAWTGDTAGSITLTQSVAISTTPSNIIVPRTPDGVRLVSIAGSPFYIPYFLS